MTNSNEIAALQAAYRGALETGASLAELRARIDALDAHAGVPSADLDDLARLSAAHAIASAALRALVNAMVARRSAA